MKRAAGDAVEIRNVAAGNGAEPVDVEVRVLGFERIESPLDQSNIAAERVVALRELQLAADAAVAMGGENGKHVRVEVGGALVETDEGLGEADEAIAIEGAQHLATGVVRDDECNVGLGFELGIAPHPASDFDAAAEVVNRVERTDGDAGHGSLVSYTLAEELATGESRGGKAMLRHVITSLSAVSRRSEESLYQVRGKVYSPA